VKPSGELPPRQLNQPNNVSRDSAVRLLAQVKQQA
jgi:hypothetical protein